MSIKGRVWKFREDVNTDDIIPAPYLNTTDPLELARHCMEGIDKNFSRKVRRGDIIVGGWNFGCGSSREHAALAIKGTGVSCVIAPRFAGIFFRNAVNIGLPIYELEVKDKEDGRRKLTGIKKGHILKIEGSEIMNLTRGEVYGITPFPDFIQNIIREGGLVKWLKHKKMHTG